MGTSASSDRFLFLIRSRHASGSARKYTATTTTSLKTFERRGKNILRVTERILNLVISCASFSSCSLHS